MSVDSHLMEFIPIIQKWFFLVSFDANSQDVNADKKPQKTPSIIQKTSSYSFEGKFGENL